MEISIVHIMKEKYIIRITIFKGSNDAVLLIFLKNDNQYAISNLILYKNWEKDSSLPKKKRKQKKEFIDSIPFR